MNPNAKSEADIKAAKKAKDLRDRVKADDAEKVMTRITKKGADKIATGQYVAGHGNIYYEVNDIVEMSRPSAEMNENKGWVEIQGEER